MLEIKDNHFSGAGRVFAKDGSGLTDVVRGILRDIFITRLMVLGLLETIAADRNISDQTMGVSSASIEDFPLPHSKVVAIRTGDDPTPGVTVAAFVDAYTAVATSAAGVAFMASDLLSQGGFSGLPQFPGSLSAGDTVAVPVSLTEASGTAAASHASVVAACLDMKARLRACINMLNLFLDRAGAPLIVNPILGNDNDDPFSETLVAITPASAGPTAALRSEVNAFLSGCASALATSIEKWNEALVEVRPDLSVVSAVNLRSRRNVDGAFVSAVNLRSRLGDDSSGGGDGGVGGGGSSS